MLFLTKLKKKFNSWNIILKKKSFKVRINDVILDENLPKPDEHTQQEQIILYIYNSEMSLFPAEIELLECRVTAFYQ